MPLKESSDYYGADSLSTELKVLINTFNFFFLFFLVKGTSNGQKHSKCQGTQIMCAVKYRLFNICYIPPCQYDACSLEPQSHGFIFLLGTISLCMISMSVILFNIINAHYAHKILVPSVGNLNKIMLRIERNQVAAVDTALPQFHSYFHKIY